MSVEILLEKFDRDDLLQVIGGLQLLHENHGKYVRFEELALLITSKGKIGSKKISHQEVDSFFKTNYTSHVHEDPVSSFLTENIIYYGGDYLVFPGLNGNGTKTLNLYLEALFTNDKLSDEFKKYTNEGVMLLLALSHALARRMNLSRNEFIEPDSNEIYVPEENLLDEAKKAVFFSEDDVKRCAKHFGIDPSSINEFVTTNIPEEVDIEDSEGSPLLEKPLVKTEGGYIFVLPSASVHVLIEFIKRKAISNKNFEVVNELYFERQWYRIRELAYEMGWRETDIQIPGIKPNNLIEGVFRFDNDKLVYVRLIKPIPENDDNSELDESNGGSEGDDERCKLAIQHLTKLNEDEEYRYFILDVLGDNGGDFYYIGDNCGNTLRLLLNYFELEKIALHKETDELTLWKFAEAFNLAKESAFFIPVPNATLNAFVHFISNRQSFFDTDTEKVTGFALVGNSYEFERIIVAERDEHSCPMWHNGELVSIPVKRFRDFAPIYREREKSREHRLALECFKPALWVNCKQGTNRAKRELVNVFTEAIIFWLYKMSGELERYINHMDLPCFEFEIDLDENIFGQNITEQADNIEFNFRLEGQTIHLRIPFEISSALLRSDNLGEKKMMIEVLNGLNLLLGSLNLETIESNTISEIIDRYMVPPVAKMIIFFDSSQDLIMDKRRLFPFRKLQESEMTKIQESLVSYLNLGYRLPANIASKKEKNDLANKVVITLINRITTILSKFDASELLKWYIKMHETCVHNRAFTKIHLPPKIACFSDFPTEVKKLKKESSELVNTTLSLRCVIEFIAAKPVFGTAIPNIDDTDELLALTNQLINWGLISDGLDLDISNPEIGLLPSGRIGITKDFTEVQLKPFLNSKAEKEVHDYVKGFEEKLNRRIAENINENAQEITDIDNAFREEYQISLTEIHQLIGTLTNVVYETDDSIIEIEKEELLKVISTKLDGKMSKQIIEIGLKLLTLSERETITKAPAGFDKTDVYPWRYNRELSYLRRPVIEVKRSDSKSYLYFGFRHMLATASHLEYLLFEGRLKVKDSGALDKYLAKINKEKGDFFREEVFDELSKNTNFKVIPYEVTIKPDGHLVADRDYGDIDVLCIDPLKKIIYSIECKNTVSARVIHEMKTEIDKYLGRNGNDGMIEKHVERDQWLKGNIEQLDQFIEDANTFKLKSFILTSQDIPLPYIKGEELKLPMLSYSKLLIKGHQALEEF
jgi:hypothetical protein